MKNYAIALAIVSFLALGLTTANSRAQILADELRPFDFSKKYYYENGVVSELLIGRYNGADGESVIDFANDPKFINVRITATLPAYDQDGNTIFWNYYAGLPKYAFTEDENGTSAIELAFATPLYVFPSSTVKDSDRQAALIRTKDTYFEKNRLGVSAVFLVEYTELIHTKTGRRMMEELAKRNGYSLDGTPIIKTEQELLSLWKNELVTFYQPSLDERYFTPFAIAKVIEYKNGGITPDSFLKYVKDVDGGPLPEEADIVAKFQCLKSGGFCS